MKSNDVDTCRRTLLHDMILTSQRFATTEVNAANRVENYFLNKNKNCTATVSYLTIPATTLSSFITCTLHQISLGWSSQGGWDGRGKYHSWDGYLICSIKFFSRGSLAQDYFETAPLGSIAPLFQVNSITLGDFQVAETFVHSSWLEEGTN
jgi:hypothetical protein